MFIMSTWHRCTVYSMSMYLQLYKNKEQNMTKTQMSKKKGVEQTD